MFIALCILGIVCLSTFLFVRKCTSSPLATILKTLTSIVFVILAVYSSLANYSYEVLYYAVFIIIGLVFGLVGDITLDLKLTYPKDNDIFTFTGMSSFAIGHIFYLAIIIMYFGFSIWALLLSIALTLITVFATIFLMKYKYEKYLIISTIYCFLLTFMMFSSLFGAIEDNFSMTTRLLFTGGVFFLISDGILSMQYFGGKDNSRLLVILNHVTYYLAQFLIAASIFTY